MYLPTVFQFRLVPGLATSRQSGQPRRRKILEGYHCSIFWEKKKHQNSSTKAHILWCLLNSSLLCVQTIELRWPVECWVWISSCGRGGGDQETSFPWKLVFLIWSRHCCPLEIGQLLVLKFSSISKCKELIQLLCICIWRNMHIIYIYIYLYYILYRKGLLWKAETTPPAPSISPLLHCARATPIPPDVSGKPRESGGKQAEALKLQHNMA